MVILICMLALAVLLLSAVDFVLESVSGALLFPPRNDVLSCPSLNTCVGGGLNWSK